MKKIINSPHDVLEQMVQGLVLAHADKLERIPNTHVVHRLAKTPDIVGLVSGGGSGHEPAHAGFVGDGMLSCAVCGEVFTSPTPDQVLEAIRAANNGRGVLLIVKNYSGDVMNFEMAEDMARMEGIEVDHIVVADDISIEDAEKTAGARGIAGTIYVHKLMGYYARQGQSVSGLKAIAEKVLPNIKTIGLALTAATVPEVGKPGFDISDDEFEYGIGIHGEPGYARMKMQPSHAMAEELVSKLKAKFGWKSGDSYAVLVNGMGSTPQMELLIFWNDVHSILEQEGIDIKFVRVEEWMTSIDMAGLSLTLFKVEDPEWVEALKAKVSTIAWNN